MATVFQPPPTYAEVIIVDPNHKELPPRFNPIWLKWFLDLVKGLNSSGGGSGTVLSVAVSTAHNQGTTLTASVANPTTTPVITITVGLGAITPSSVAATGTVTGSNLSGTNTGDQTSVSGNAGTATALQTARTIGGVSFNGTANITVQSATGNFAVTLALTAATVQVGSAGGYISSDGSTGFTGTVTTASLVGKTITIKDGIITGFA